MLYLTIAHSSACLLRAFRSFRGNLAAPGLPFAVCTTPFVPPRLSILNPPLSIFASPASPRPPIFHLPSSIFEIVPSSRPAVFPVHLPFSAFRAFRGQFPFSAPRVSVASYFATPFVPAPPPIFRLPSSVFDPLSIFAAVGVFPSITMICQES